MAYSTLPDNLLSKGMVYNPASNVPYVVGYDIPNLWKVFGKSSEHFYSLVTSIYNATLKFDRFVEVNKIAVSKYSTYSIYAKLEVYYYDYSSATMILFFTDTSTYTSDEQKEFTISPVVTSDFFSFKFTSPTGGFYLREVQLCGQDAPNPDLLLTDSKKLDKILSLLQVRTSSELSKMQTTFRNSFKSGDYYLTDELLYLLNYIQNP